IVVNRVVPGRIAAAALAERPAEVGAGATDVDVLARGFLHVAAHFAEEQPVGDQIPVRAEGVAQAVGPDFVEIAAGAVDEGVVSRHRAVAVDADDLAASAAEVLRLRAVELLAGGEVQAAVRAEGEPAAVVAAVGPVFVVLPDHYLAGGIGPVAAGGEARNPVPRRTHAGVVNVEMAVDRVVGVEYQAVDAAFATPFDVGDLHEAADLRRLLARIEAENAAVFLRQQHRAIRQLGQHDGFIQV